MNIVQRFYSVVSQIYVRIHLSYRMPRGLHVTFRIDHFDCHCLVFMFMKITGFGSSTTDKSISSWSHLASTMVVSNVVSFTSIVDLIGMVCLQDFYETTSPPSVEWRNS